MSRTAPTGQRYWLKMHQVTAFWHGFGISNGLTVPKEHIKLIRYEKGTPREVYQVSPEYMRAQLAEYIKWLKQYQEAWSIRDDHPHGIETRAAFMKDEAAHPARLPIIEMLELIQACRIDDQPDQP